MSAEQPSVVVLAGPNGAGKSTAAPLLLRGAMGLTVFVNADVIAQGLAAYDPEGAALAAGRIMLARLHELAAQRQSFAFETTLAARSFAPWLRRLLTDGYHFHLAYLWLPSAEAAIERVAERVLTGGHDIPEDVVRRRYEGGLRNFHRIYQPLASSWAMYDNGHGSPPRLVAFGAAEEINIVDADIWRSSLAAAGS